MSVPLIAGFSLAEVQTPGLDESFFCCVDMVPAHRRKYPELFSWNDNIE